MKKIFSFAIALVACALAFTSCDPYTNSPLVGSWLANGTLTLLDATTGVSKVYDANHSIHFFDNGQFQYNVYIKGTTDGIFKRGVWAAKGDQLTLRTQKAGEIRSNEFVYDNSFKTTDEVVTWSIDGHYLTLTHADGSKEIFYDGSGPN